MVYDFGLRLKASRKDKKLTQNQVAELIGTTKSSISGYENNTSFPPIEILKKLALLYEVSCDYLLGMENRHTIILENLNDRQYDIIDNIVCEICKEFELLNKNIK